MFVARELLRGLLVPMWCKKNLKTPQKKFQARAQTKRTPFLLIKKNNKKKR
jgi:hypothetical protein